MFDIHLSDKCDKMSLKKSSVLHGVCLPHHHHHHHQHPISIHILHINSSHLSISSTHHISTDNDNGEGAQNKHIDLDNVDHNNHSPPSSDMISMILYDIIRLNDLIILIESCLTV